MASVVSQRKTLLTQNRADFESLARNTFRQRTSIRRSRVLREGEDGARHSGVARRVANSFERFKNLWRVRAGRAKISRRNHTTATKPLALLIALRVFRQK